MKQIAANDPASLKRILLVEDDERDIELTLAALADYHLANEVIVARDGAEALDYLYARGRFKDRPGTLPAVVLLDLKLPKVDGMEVLQRMKLDPVLKQVPVVVLTVSRAEQDLVRSYELGVDAYVNKPMDIQKFIESIREVGHFWAVVNEPPAASGKDNRNPAAQTTGDGARSETADAGMNQPGPGRPESSLRASRASRTSSQ